MYDVTTAKKINSARNVNRARGQVNDTQTSLCASVKIAINAALQNQLVIFTTNTGEESVGCRGIPS